MHIGVFLIDASWNMLDWLIEAYLKISLKNGWYCDVPCDAQVEDFPYSVQTLNNKFPEFEQTSTKKHHYRGCIHGGILNKPLILQYDILSAKGGSFFPLLALAAEKYGGICKKFGAPEGMDERSHREKPFSSSSSRS